MKKVSAGVIVSLFIPLMAGGVSALLSAKGMAGYASMNKPPLSPPAWVFPVAWTILYLMMGFAAYLVYAARTGSDSCDKVLALALYAIQLLMNFFWSVIFFVMGAYLVAFVWLFVMWALVILCAFRFYPISKPAAYLLVPYILWLTFAAYLNMGTYIINMKG